MAEYKMVRLGDVCEIQSGGTPSRSKTEYWKDGTIPWVKIGDFSGKYLDKTTEHITQQGLDNSSAKLFSKGTILYSIFATLGEATILNIDATTNQAIAGIKIKDKSSVDIDYFYSFLKSLKDEVNRIGRGVAQNNINLSILKSFFIPLPPLETQKQIAAQLDKCTAVIAKHKQMLEKYDTLIKSRFIEMFGDPVQNPKGWKKTELGNLCKEVRYGTSKPASENGKYTYLRMNNITYEGELDLTNIKSIDISEDELPKCSVRKGDVLFNRTNSIELCGKTCLYKLDKTMVIAGYIIRVRVSEKLNPQYVSTLFNTKSIKKLLREMAKGAVNQANINAQEMQSIQIPVPPISLQNEYESFVQQIDKSKFAVQKSLEKAETLYKSLMQEYFG